MSYLNKILEDKELSIEEHNKIFNDLFSKIIVNIETDKYRKEVNSIYWLTCEIFKISFVKYFKDIKITETSTSNKVINSVFYCTISSVAKEMADLLMKENLMLSSISNYCRILLETMLFHKEIETRKIDEIMIFHAAFASHNKHVGANLDSFKDLNLENPGLFKVFKETIRLNKFARKHNYGWLYKLLSGDNHLISTANNLFILSKDDKYNKIYLSVIKSFLIDLLLYINSTLENKKDYSNELKDIFCEVIKDDEL